MLFYISNTVKKVDDGYTGDWLGLYSFDLESRKHYKIADKDSLRLPPPYAEGWITSLVGASTDATELYLTVGMMPPDSTQGFRMVDHQLAKMNLTTRDIHPLSGLKGAFF